MIAKPHRERRYPKRNHRPRTILASARRAGLEAVFAHRLKTRGIETAEYMVFAMVEEFLDLGFTEGDSQNPSVLDEVTDAILGLSDRALIERFQRWQKFLRAIDAPAGT